MNAPKRIRSTTAPETSATVMMQNVAWKAKNRRCGIVEPVARLEADVLQERVVEAADDLVAVAEGERVADGRPGHRRDRDRRDAHHERVERVLRAHEPRVEEAERGGHEQDERGGDEHPRGVARVDRPTSGSLTGVTAPCRSRPVRMRTARSSGTTKILPSPTSPVRPPSQSASIVGSTNGVGDRDLEADLLGEAHLHRGAAVGLDAVELAAVALHAAHRYSAHLGAVERLQHVVGLLGPNDPDDELHLSHPP